MAIKVGINGYGRIGRNVLRALYESRRSGELQIVAINDLGDANTNAHLTRFDTAHGRFPGEVSVEGDSIVVNGDRIRVLAAAPALVQRAQHVATDAPVAVDSNLDRHRCVLVYK